MHSFLQGSAAEVAPRLLGCELVTRVGDWVTRGKIVETEAYDQTDAASHSYKGQTPRTDVMFGSPGYLYVYFTYGMHYCCNIVVGQSGHGAAVLIRAIEPLEGQSMMAQRRGVTTGSLLLTNGPAKLCQALGIDRTMNGQNLMSELESAAASLIVRPALDSKQIVQTTRIGISQAKDVRWRFYIRDNRYVSKR